MTPAGEAWKVSIFANLVTVKARYGKTHEDALCILRFSSQKILAAKTLSKFCNCLVRVLAPGHEIVRGHDISIYIAQVDASSTLPSGTVKRRSCLKFQSTSLVMFSEQVEEETRVSNVFFTSNRRTPSNAVVVGSGITLSLRSS